jgi:hypothetical protein
MNRIERILHKLTVRYAPHLSVNGALTDSAQDTTQDATSRVYRLAQKLANYGILVIVADTPPELMAQQKILVGDWIDGYVHLYDIMTKILFPIRSELTAFYADDETNNPSVVVLSGAAAPVLASFGRFIVPYVGLRQKRQLKPDEIDDVLSAMLDTLEAADLPHKIYQALHTTSATALKQILNAPVRQIALTDFDMNLIDIVKRHGNTQPFNALPTHLPEQQKRQEPLQLEELDSDEPDTPTENMFRVDVPFKRPKRMPPVPPLPHGDDDENE